MFMGTNKFFVACLLLGYSWAGLASVESNLKTIKDISSVILHTSKVYGSTEATLKRYNQLRLLLKKPIADTIDDIDFSWIEEVEQEASLLYEEESAKFMQELWREYMPTGNTYSSVEAANNATRALINEAREALGIKEDLIMLSGRSWAIASTHDNSSPSVISLEITDNIDKARYHAYHELSHIFYKHMRMRWDAGEHNRYSVYLERPEFLKATQQAEQYIKLARQALDSSTTTGARIKKKIADNPPFWVPSPGRPNYQENLLRINIEREADLYAFEKLFEQGHIGSILFVIDKYSRFKVTDYGESDHPSALEMALYASGFLIQKGLDINKELKSWESKSQQSKPIEIIKSKGAEDLLKAYHEWHQPSPETKKVSLAQPVIDFGQKTVIL